MRLVPLLCAFALAACATPSAPLPAFSNPVLDEDFPDPAVLKAPDGAYYAYATQSERGGVKLNVQVARSPDLVHWTHLGDALPARPAWASRTWDFWAPHVVRRDGRYFLYYSARPDAALADPKQGLCLAVATADRPEGPFTDSGRPLESGYANLPRAVPLSRPAVSRPTSSARKRVRPMRS
jgi:arabinan endo-1,5-alpha-L-arabinosidase